MPGSVATRSGSPSTDNGKDAHIWTFGFTKRRVRWMLHARKHP